jgi:hypothetical protein
MPPDRSEHVKSAGPRADPRAVALSFALGGALLIAALVASGHARLILVEIASYIIGWRVVLLHYAGRERNGLVMFGLVIAAGFIFGEWWAPALVAVNLAFRAMFGPPLDTDDPMRGWRWFVGFGAFEASLLAVGVALSRLVG